MTPTNSPQGVELLPCRFCNSKQLYFAEREVGWMEDHETDQRVVVVCSRCGAQGPAFGAMSFNNEGTAAQYWNDDTRADLPRATADGLLFKNACRLHTEWTIDRYLMSNAANRCDPAEKVERHIELCKFYVAAVRGCSPEDAMSDYEQDFDRLHEESQELTSSLDTAIGFPLDQIPDYNDLNPKFFEQFHAIACRVLGVSATPRANGETTVEGWWPIETAPRDGSSILVAYLEYGVGPSFLVSSASWCEVGWKGCSTDRDFYFPPTYWQPLPAPPVRAAAQTKAESGEG